jgi:desampylase
MECPRSLMERLHEEAGAAGGREICGLLIGAGGAIAEALPIRNAAPDPGRRFALDPRDHLRASREARTRGYRILGCYHSHPGGDIRPSPADAEGAAEQSFHWLILAGGRQALWTSRAGGALHAAFDPLRLEIV